jgi:hypothetical protein
MGVEPVMKPHELERLAVYLKARVSFYVTSGTEVRPALPRHELPQLQAS